MVLARVLWTVLTAAALCAACDLESGEAWRACGDVWPRWGRRCGADVACLRGVASGGGSCGRAAEVYARCLEWRARLGEHRGSPGCRASALPAVGPATRWWLDPYSDLAGTGASWGQVAATCCHAGPTQAPHPPWTSGSALLADTAVN
eukprot:715489-Rhodomonas_salina.1